MGGKGPQLSLGDIYDTRWRRQEWVAWSEVATKGTRKVRKNSTRFTTEWGRVRQNKDKEKNVREKLDDFWLPRSQSMGDGEIPFLLTAARLSLIYSRSTMWPVQYARNVTHRMVINPRKIEN